jgi:hypothetical protein
MMFELLLENLPEGWRKLEPPEAHSLAQQLRQELSQEHQLAAATEVRALARSISSDDVLYEVMLKEEHVLAQVHLTYGKPSDARFPWTEVFRSGREWREQAASVE